MIRTARFARCGPKTRAVSVRSNRSPRKKSRAVVAGRFTGSPHRAARASMTATRFGRTRPSQRPSDESPSGIRAVCRERRSVRRNARYAAKFRAPGMKARRRRLGRHCVYSSRAPASTLARSARIRLRSSSCSARPAGGETRIVIAAARPNSASTRRSELPAPSSSYLRSRRRLFIVCSCRSGYTGWRPGHEDSNPA